jgi:hypothetical protein
MYDDAKRQDPPVLGAHISGGKRHAVEHPVNPQAAKGQKGDPRKSPFFGGKPVFKEKRQHNPEERGGSGGPTTVHDGIRKDVKENDAADGNENKSVEHRYQPRSIEQCLNQEGPEQ